MKIKYTAILTGAIVLSTALSGCNKPSTPPEEVVTAFLEDFSNMDYEGMYELTQDKHQYFKDIYLDDNSDNTKIFKTLSDNIEYEVGDVETSFWNKDATVEVDIRNIDSKIAMNGIMTDLFSKYEEYEDELDQHDMDAELDQIVEDRLNPETAPRTNTNTVFNLINQDGQWVIESNVLIYDDITGGYFTYYFQNNFANTLTD